MPSAPDFARRLRTMENQFTRALALPVGHVVTFFRRLRNVTILAIRFVALLFDPAMRRRISNDAGIRRALKSAAADPVKLMRAVQKFEFENRHLQRSLLFRGGLNANHFADQVGEDTLVSIIIVNLNGKHHFDELFESLAVQTHKKIEIIVVDNGSSDGSVQYLQNHPLKPNLVLLDENVGFAQANNIGADEALGELLCLLNNDTRVEPDFVEKLVAGLKRNTTAAAVGPKIRFRYPFYTVDIKLSEVGEAELDLEHLGRSFAFYPKFFFPRGFSEASVSDGVNVRRFSSAAQILLPVADDQMPIRMRVRALNANREVTVTINGKSTTTKLSAGRWLELKLDQDDFGGDWLINNAGSMVTQAGDVGDRGFGMRDDGAWDIEEPVTALCGCAMLIRRSALEGEAVFSPHFFAYFEDTDLSMRLRKKHYQLVYCPDSIVYHKHASTSGENSPTFRFLVNRNRQLFFAANFPNEFSVKARADSKAELTHFKHYCKSNAVTEVEAEFAQRIDELFDDWDRLLPLIEAGTFYDYRRHLPRQGVYNSFWNSLGGGEYHAAAIAEGLQSQGPVDLISETDFSVETVAQQFGLNLDRCRKVIVSSQKLHHDPKVTRNYDLFINSTYGSDLISRASKSIYVVSFPFNLSQRPEHIDDFVASYDHFFSNSKFTAGWCDKYWGVEADVVYPSVKEDVVGVPLDAKTKSILNIGRFFRNGHNKKQLEMAKAFIKMRGEGRISDEWKLTLCGQVEKGHEGYFEEVKAVAKGHPIELRRDVPRGQLEALLSSGAIYWHATGLDEDLERFPERAEHFGIAILEAMLNGCVPIVIDAGGPPEIVRQGQCGFVFSDVAELMDRTQDAVALFEESDTKRYEAMAVAARARALDFNKESMQGRVQHLLGLQASSSIDNQTRN